MISSSSSKLKVVSSAKGRAFVVRYLKDVRLFNGFRIFNNLFHISTGKISLKYPRSATALTTIGKELR